MKPSVVIMGPVQTRSGYGDHTRDLAYSLIESDKYDVKIVSMPWGVTPMDGLKSDDEKHQAIEACIARQNITVKPDVFIQISVPNEFQAMGKYSIGITAGIETDTVSSEFLEGCNRMDLIVTTSEHSANGFRNTTYEKRDKNTNQPIGTLRLEKPIRVLFEGLDLEVYTKDKPDYDTVLTELKAIKDPFCFLFVGHWLKGDIGADRKDIGMLIKTFCEAFKNKAPQNRPALILKTSHATFSIMDRDEVMRKVHSITSQYGHWAPNIYLIHGDLTESEMNALYNHPKIKAMISFTHGEGFGRPLLEFTVTEKPVIAPNWSGQIDFLKHAVLLPGEVKSVHPSAADQFILQDSKWFTVNYGYAAAVIRDVFENYKNYLDNARKQASLTKREFNMDAMAAQLVAIVDSGLTTVPQQLQLQLPKLKKPGETETPKITLPKLKKVEDEARV
jgi:glycosyltransferase involved in cell wall biosynthesis